MPLIGDIGKKISQSASDSAKKTRIFMEVSKLNSQITDEQKTIASFNTQIGEKYYALFGTNPQEEFAQLCEYITASNQKIASIEAEIKRVRNVRVCPKCGAECDASLLFCGSCGEALPKVETDGKKFCENCGKQLSATATFCNECGTRT